MAKFTASVDLNLRLPSGEEVIGTAGATHRISDPYVTEFIRDVVPLIPGGVTWITQDEASAIGSVTGVTLTEIDGAPSSSGITLLAVPNQLLAISGASATLGPLAAGSLGGLHTVSTISASGATATATLANGSVFDITLTATTVTLVLQGATSSRGCFATILLRQDSTGSRTVTWPGSVVWPGSIAPTLSTAAGAVDEIGLLTLDGGTTWYGVPPSVTLIPTMVGAKVYSAVTQSVGSATWTAATFPAEEWKTIASMHSTATNTSRITVDVTRYYDLNAGIAFAANSAGVRWARFYKNGTTELRGAVNRIYNDANNATLLNLSGRELLAAGDYVEVQVFQDGFSSLNIGSATTWLQNWFSVVARGV